MSGGFTGASPAPPPTRRAGQARVFSIPESRERIAQRSEAATDVSQARRAVAARKLNAGRGKTKLGV